MKSGASGEMQRDLPYDPLHLKRDKNRLKKEVF